MACAMVAAGLSRLLSRPMYQELADLLPVPPQKTADPGR
jgi:hypothetical protein